MPCPPSTGSSLHPPADLGPATPAPRNNSERPEVVGSICRADSNCKARLRCHRNTKSHIGHGQCTVVCDCSDAWESEFGEVTLCIGASICITSCAMGPHCPEPTSRGKAGWCSRQSPGSGPACARIPNYRPHRIRLLLSPGMQRQQQLPGRRHDLPFRLLESCLQPAGWLLLEQYQQVL